MVLRLRGEPEGLGYMWKSLFESAKNTEWLLSLWEALFGVEGYLKGWRAPALGAAVTGILGLIQSQPLMNIFVGVLLAIAAISVIANRFGVRHGLLQNGEASKENSSASRSLWIAIPSYGYTERRARSFSRDGKKWQGISIGIQSQSDRTLRGLIILLNCRTWNHSLSLTSYKDASTHTIRLDESKRAIPPRMGVSFEIVGHPIEGNTGAAFLGDLEDEMSDVQEIPHGKHFVTITVFCDDQAPEFKNFVIITKEGLPPYLLEYDSRKWGHPDDAPTPFHSYSPMVR